MAAPFPYGCVAREAKQTYGRRRSSSWCVAKKIKKKSEMAFFLRQLGPCSRSRTGGKRCIFFIFFIYFFMAATLPYGCVARERILTRTGAVGKKLQGSLPVGKGAQPFSISLPPPTAMLRRAPLLLPSLRAGSKAPLLLEKQERSKGSIFFIVYAAFLFFFGLIATSYAPVPTLRSHFFFFFLFFYSCEARSEFLLATGYPALLILATQRPLPL
jgi:hypothetical protein